MGGERAQEMTGIWALPAEITSMLRALQPCKNACRAANARFLGSVDQMRMTTVPLVTVASIGPAARLGDQEIAEDLQLDLILHRIRIAEISVEGRHFGLRQNLDQSRILADEVVR